MRIAGGHLTYCSNIHPGEQWAAHFAELRRALPWVKARLAAHAPFGVGLRLGAAAARALAAPRALAELRAFLDQHGLYLFTLNGFPYGAFHGTVVKERVYRPDWRRRERLDYTLELAGLLAALLPPGEVGSISTVPLGFRPDFTDPSAFAQAAERLAEAAAALHRGWQEHGHDLCLALEPEPGCAVETTAELLEFYQCHMWRGPGLARMRQATGLTADAAEAALRRHLGLCLDACHAAVMFEEPRQTLALVHASGVRLAKLQLSAALQVAPLGDAALARLGEFVDPVYLHQVVARHGEQRRFHLDLPAALADGTGEEWRIHFHLPLFYPGDAPLGTTRAFLATLLAHYRQAPFCPHLEVETYTWDVLPARLRPMALEEGIVRELNWVLEEMRR